MIDIFLDESDHKMMTILALKSSLRHFYPLIIKQTPRLCVLRCFSSKVLHNKPIINIRDVEDKDEKDLSKVKVTLKDENGLILGVKSMFESLHLAKKLSLNLIEEKDPNAHHKYQVMKMVSNKYLAQMDSISIDIDDIGDHKSGDSYSKSSTKVEVKRLLFSAKLNDNDLMTKIKACKRWLAKGHFVSIIVTNSGNNQKNLEMIYNKFEEELKAFAKFNQKKIKNNNNLKFMIVTTDQTKDLLKEHIDDHHISDSQIDVQNMDPNRLLSDEFEKQLNESEKK
ncbi:uncharacterized protein LOC128952252 [Oppia nitens]|uniref:uncharacterized protein LOC128952252 n=1 Tax=Oppia nitens TaxID=1686743 RepID=UPI0023D9E158|nr:uncharacterized protein LOC128952252 [Oppia nitens]